MTARPRPAPAYFRKSYDDGFTLVELLVTVVIMGVIILPVSSLVINYFTTTSTTSGRLDESHDQQLAAAYFAQDIATVGTRVQSTLALQQSIWRGSFPDGSCGSAASAANQLLLIKSDDVTWNTTTAQEDVVVNSVAYIKVLAASGDIQLHRVFCVGGTQRSDITIVHNIDPAVATAVSCPTTCESASVPVAVTLTVGIKERSGSGQGFTMTLTGQRRQT